MIYSAMFNLMTMAISTHQLKNQKKLKKNRLRTVETPTQDNEPFLNIRYNKEDIGLSKEEAIELAQKGKNYDRVNERYTALNSKLERLARLNGNSIDEYLEKLNEAQIVMEEDAEYESLSEKYPNTDEEVLRMLAHQNVANAMGVRENEYNAQLKEQSDAQEAEIQRQVENFKREYPDVTPENMPQEVIDDINSGNYTLLEAYNKWAIREMRKDQPAIEAKQKAEKLNEENKKKSLGSTTNASGIEATDDFFSGLNSI